MNVMALFNGSTNGSYKKAEPKHDEGFDLRFAQSGRDTDVICVNP